ncbi:YraN family protein [Candidatus Peregrinibacteria bacterium]|nr:MAG: YraN family protein [Candidatus Peregrinibacteria bacterium]
MDVKELGKRGEALAIEFLVKKGYRIDAVNFRNRLGEVDVIAFDPGRHEIVFVEVKTRRTHTFGEPEAAVHGLKLSTIEMVAESYLETIASASDEWRVDIISISISPQNVHIEHLENVGED